MRIRSIRPEFWTSEDIAALDWHQRLIYIGLWSYVDDNGVGRDLEPLIVAALFPLDPDVSEASLRVHGALKRLHQGGQIIRYTVSGRPYLYVAAWERHQKINRPSGSRYPLPICEDAEIHEPLSEYSVNPHANAPLGEGEKGRRGEGEKILVPAPRGRATEAEPDGFADFYDAYPRKEKRRTAAKAYAAALRRTDPTTILAGAQRFAADPNLPERQYIPHPATWLNGDGWDDDPLPERRPTGRGAPAKPSEAEWWEQQLAAASQPPPEGHRQIENWRTA